ncbi:MAG: alanine racemase [Clostridiales bacterium]|nr:alanine racemase [Clostridiales bacterium]
MEKRINSPIRGRNADRRALRTWIEVDKKALEHNLHVFRHRIPLSCRIMAVAKSNAYGHGLYDFVPLMETMAVDWFGVDSIVEAVTLRTIGVRKPVLVLGYTLPGRFPEAIKHRVSLTISSMESLRGLAALPDCRKIKIHLKLDTGMHRQGFLPNLVGNLVAYLKTNENRFHVEGVYTHFASAKDPRSRNYTKSQIGLFERALALLHEAGYHPLRHACATASALNYPEAHYDMVRIGIGLMGLWPSAETRGAWEKAVALKPALTWRTILSETKRLKKGAGIGYDLTETLARDSTVGVCPIGYWHGFPRSLSRVGEVLIRGRRAKVLGSVSMDMIVVDLTGVPGVRVGDIVTVIGKDGEAEITPYEVAAKARVSPYELLTRINPLIQKFYK